MLLGVFPPVLGNRFSGYSAEGGWVGYLCGVGVGVGVGLGRMWWLSFSVTHFQFYVGLRQKSQPGPADC